MLQVNNGVKHSQWKFGVRYEVTQQCLALGLTNQTLSQPKFRSWDLLPVVLVYRCWRAQSMLVQVRYVKEAHSSRSWPWQRYGKILSYSRDLVEPVSLETLCVCLGASNRQDL